MNEKFVSKIGSALAVALATAIAVMILMCFARFEMPWDFNDQDWKIYRVIVAVIFGWEWFRPRRGEQND